MKNQIQTLVRSRLKLRRAGLALAVRLAAACCLGLAGGTARAQENELQVGVRSDVKTTTAIWPEKTKTPGAAEYGRIYGVLSVQPIKSDDRLVKPMDERALTTYLLHELDANGFREFKPGQQPDILLTVSYGRGTLHNPYIRDAGEMPAGTVQHPPAGPGLDDTPTVSITGAFPLQLTDEKTPGYQEKLQRAQYEKLYIRVTAWNYPASPKDKSKILCKTIMVFDDPDHRDLNAVAAKMLEAGAPYFGKKIKDPEVEVHQPLPEVQINVGAPKVIEMPAKGK